ncbi:MAG: type II secretion system protein [Armatimonadota bacterium]|nr:type II secretion system protein [Armatimonadota bacterium]
MNTRHRGEGGFTFVEVLAVILVLGVLVAIALPNYFGAEADARTAVRTANVRSINTALALYQYRNGGACPADATTFTAFLNNTTYFPDGAPTDPVAGGQTFFTTNYNASRCRVVIP